MDGWMDTAEAGGLVKVKYSLLLSSAGLRVSVQGQSLRHVHVAP